MLAIRVRIAVVLLVILRAAFVALLRIIAWRRRVLDSVMLARRVALGYILATLLDVGHAIHVEEDAVLRPHLFQDEVQ